MFVSSFFSKNSQEKLLTFLDINHPEGFLIMALRMVLLIGYRHFDPLLLFLTLPGLLIYKVAVNRYYWLAVTIVFAARYPLFDLRVPVFNHQYVIILVMLLATLTLFAKNMAEDVNWRGFLAKNSSLLIGLIFALATFFKLTQPDFMNGVFFEYTSFFDSRFVSFTSWLLEPDKQTMPFNREAFARIFHTHDPDNIQLAIKGSAKVDIMSQILVYWTLFIEGSLAILFLLPDKLSPARLKDPFLLIFIISTYPLATVVGFALPLLWLGFVQSYQRANKWYSIAYFTLFVVSSIFGFPLFKILKVVL